jgi:hypothetical protein
VTITRPWQARIRADRALEILAEPGDPGGDGAGLDAQHTAGEPGGFERPWVADALNGADLVHG